MDVFRCSSNGNKIIFDLLGDIYELPMEGGKGKSNKEIAFDSQQNTLLMEIPFFLSDKWRNNVWFKQKRKRHNSAHRGEYIKIQSADWSPDGNYIAVSKGTRNFKLHLYHKDGGGGTQLISEPERLKFLNPRLVVMVVLFGFLKGWGHGNITVSSISN